MNYTLNRDRVITTTAKNVLQILARGSRGGLISVGDAAELLGVSTKSAAVRLASLARQGWVIRVRRGFYLVLPLEARANQSTTTEDSWVLANVLFAPCYIGGWSAAEHWGLTEQLFRSTFVVTASNARHTSDRFLNLDFKVVRVKESRFVGTTSVWRGTERVLVSDREKTIIDALSSPEWVGGVRHLYEILGAYFGDRNRSLENLTKQLAEGKRGAACKRLGFLVEKFWPDLEQLREVAQEHKTSGYIRLDPSVSSRGRLNKKWGIWANVVFESERP